MMPTCNPNDEELDRFYAPLIELEEQARVEAQLKAEHDYRRRVLFLERCLLSGTAAAFPF